MPVTPTYPGVYIEEIPSGVRTISGVATSVAAFVDFFSRGPMNKAVQIFNMGDFERELGGLHTKSEASYAIQQFFLNGGTEAWVVRLASGSFAAAQVQISDDILPGSSTLTVTAISEGIWGNNIRVKVDNNVPKDGEFNLIISEYGTVGARIAIVRQEIFCNLSMNSGQTNFVQTLVNDQNTGSKLVRVPASGTAPPLANGTLSGEHPDGVLIPALPVLSVTIGNVVGTDITQTTRMNFPKGTTLPATLPLTTIAPALEAAIRGAAPANPAFSEVAVDVISRMDSTGNVLGRRLRILAGPGDPRNRVRFATVNVPTASALLLTTGTSNVIATLSDIHGANPTISSSTPTVEVTIGNDPPVSATLAFPPGTVPGQIPLAVVAPLLQDAINTAGGDVRVFVTGTPNNQQLVILHSDNLPTSQVTLSNAGADNTASELRLTTTDITNVTATLSDFHTANPNITATPDLVVKIDNTSAAVTLAFPAGTVPGLVPLADVAQALQAAIRNAVSGDPLFNKSVVFVADSLGGQQLVILPGEVTANPVTFADSTGGQVAAALLLTATDATANAQEYTLGGGSVDDTAQLGGALGDDGSPPDGQAFTGDPVSKQGIFALEDVDLFNLLCIPRTAIVNGTDALPPPEVQTVLTLAQTYCEKRRAFFLMDTPTGIDEPQEIKNALTHLPRHRNAALYYPRLHIPDPLSNFQLRSVGASGTIAGLCARTDSARGVWKAPAGTEATLRNVPELEDVLTDAENGTLNPLAINCLRNFPVYGNICWGARTLEGADQQASEWKYIPVRRLALFLEESLYRGLKWVVFEPNDEPLWAQIRLNVGSFMHNLFRQGAFQGQTPREAYLVKCDKETTTQTDINAGIVNIVVGFAPLKPAEFVIIKIQQLAGQIQT
jgi:phage tail sheath protein FI